MNKNDYLRQLEEQLRGAVSNQELMESVQFYRDYIEEEMRKGRTEEEVLDDLGSANSIAKSIIEARGFDTDYEEEAVYESDSPSYEEESPKTKVFWADGWQGTAILIGIVVLIIMLFVFAFKILAFLSPVLVPVMIGLFVIKLIQGKR